MITAPFTSLLVDPSRDELRRVVPCECVADEYGSDGVPGLSPKSTFMTDILSAWPYIKTLQHWFDDKLFPEDKITGLKGGALRLPNLPLKIHPQLDQTDTAMVFMLPIGLMQLGRNRESFGPTLVMHIPDATYMERWQRFRAPDVLTHFMSDPDLPVVTKLSEYVENAKGAMEKRQREAYKHHKDRVRRREGIARDPGLTQLMKDLPESTITRTTQIDISYPPDPQPNNEGPIPKIIEAQRRFDEIKEGSERSAETIQEAIEKIQEHVQRRMREMRVAEVLRNSAEPTMLEAADQSTETTRRESKSTMTENKKVEG